ncbi:MULTISPECIES: trigger factor [Glutamicibacter]|uniref:Trigger factor n=1 Tax=Glutamicibacter halophytocola TaxID=1933880 RepID=A0A5B8IIP3_9MICC|nr:trigger factor [Glutamicibacter halophytocola]MBF6673322.1 trigger factor [Glutamicibacter sp. FBE19]ALG29216.1 trigger factor [Glutamicibacter halophytocola]NQD39166.1 trigger factor [Glutamicibacter halophytocola]QDY65474.1 trigger factor [Glutamicibacter halophytocola]UUX57570.1 trigger factor [Glutamicibacter halophytocola]
MKSAVENVNPTRVKLTVEVPYEELKPRVDEAYKTIAQQIQIPGFRKGKVPSRLIDQRVGRGYVIETAVNEGLNDFYQKAMVENELTPLSRPEVDITELPSIEKEGEGQLVFTLEVDIRPKVELPDYKGIEVSVEAKEVADEDIEKALDDLRGRFGTLKEVEAPAAADSFVTIDLTASVDGEEVDSAQGLSYQIGSGNMLEGMDEAVTGLSAGEDATFETTLAGGEHAGKAATVKVVINAVKQRELPEANDDFAQLASEFDTIAELRENLAKDAAEGKIVEQGVEARELVLDKLVELVEVPVPASVIDEQIEQHFNAPDAEADHDTEEHRSEVRENTERAFKNEIILDAVADAEEVGVEQSELIDYIVQTAGQYGMEPNQFAQMLDGAGQVPMLMGEVRRRKALAKVLEFATVTDSNGAAVDLTSFVKPAGEEEAAEAEVEEAK